jgi:heat shock protein 4
MAEAARKAAMAQEAVNKDEEMTDVETTKPDEIVEPEEKK